MAAMTADEIPLWFEHHTTVCPRHDWPTDAAFWATWRGRIARLKCDLQTACEASTKVAEAPPRFASDHLAAVCDAVTAIYRERDARRGSTDGLAERARRGEELSPGEVGDLARLCRSCPSCGGLGLLVRSEPGEPLKRFTLHCTCAKGRWVRARCVKTAPDVVRRVRDLAEHPECDGEEYGGPGRSDVPFGAELEPAF